MTESQPKDLVWSPNRNTSENGKTSLLSSSSSSSLSEKKKKRNGLLTKLFCNSKGDDGCDGLLTSPCVGGNDLLSPPSHRNNTSEGRSLWSPKVVKTMKTPGLIIPTPDVKYREESDQNDNHEVHGTKDGRAVDHDHDYNDQVCDTNGDDDSTKVVTNEITPGTPPIKSPQVVDDDDDDDDDAAFLPDDFLPSHFAKTIVPSPQFRSESHVQNKENNFAMPNVPRVEVLTPPKTILLQSEVQQQLQQQQQQATNIEETVLQDAKREWQEQALQQLERDKIAELERIRVEAENQLEEHGVQWNLEHEEEIFQLRKEFDETLARERKKWEQQLQHLIHENKDKEQAMEHERMNLMEQISALTQQIDKEKHESKRHLEELQAEQAAVVEKLEKDLEQQQQQAVQHDAAADAESKALMEQIARLETNIKQQGEDYERQQRELQIQHEEQLTHAKEMLENALEQQQRHALQHVETAAEAKALMEQIALLEANAKQEGEDSEREINELQIQHEKQIAEAKDELDQANMALREYMDSAEQEVLASTVERQRLIDKIALLEADVDTSRSIHETKVQELAYVNELERKQLENEFDVRLQSERHARDEILQKQTMEHDEAKGDLIAKIEALEADAIKQREEHELRRQAIQDVCVQQMEDLRRDLNDASDKQQNELIAKQAEEQKAMEEVHANKCYEMEEQYEKQQLELKEMLAAQQEQFEKDKNDLLMKQSKLNAMEKELLDEISSMQTMAVKDHEEYERKVQMVRHQHAAEIDEMLAQLDLIEAEHSERYGEKEQAVIQKDAIIAALGSQLAEATARITRLETEHEQLLSQVTVSREELDLAMAAGRSLELAMERLRADHKKALEEEGRKREEACQQAKEEMIAAAEAQFGKANEHYIKLKHEYDLTVAKMCKIERELKASKRDLEIAMKEQAAKDIEITAKLAQLNAAIAAAEANAARNAKEYITELDELRESHRILQSKLDEATINCTTAHMSLASIVTEKQRLLKEHEEMKAVCEELMAIVEGVQQ